MARKSWGFYGRADQLKEMVEILDSRSWFFVKMSGRRRIGKTRLVLEALKKVNSRPSFYVQIPDSGEAGVLSAVVDAMETFEVPSDRHPRPRTIGEFARQVEAMVRDGYVVVLDEFQYFNRKAYTGFCSLLQAVVDRLVDDAGPRPGGLIVLGSVHSEMAALLEERSAPLYNRISANIELTHLDIAAVVQLLRAHADDEPSRLLSLWNLFEGVPKYYRDCYERGVLDADLDILLDRMFFGSASPFRSEAENWFLRELKGRYDSVLKLVARNPGSTHGDLIEAVRRASGEEAVQVGSYLQTLVERYRLVVRKAPIFAKEKERRGRYYLADNFLQSWLAALSNPVSAIGFRPTDRLVDDARKRLAILEGTALEKLVGTLYEERSRRTLAGFSLTSHVQGYWDGQGIEIDLVALDEDHRVIRFGSCKRSPRKLVADVNNFRGHVQRFLDASPRFAGWRKEFVAIAPELDDDHRDVLGRHGVEAEDLDDLTWDLA